MAVKINGNDQFMILEKAPVREFIERFGFREAPIVEGNERQLWQNRSLNSMATPPLEWLTGHLTRLYLSKLPKKFPASCKPVTGLVVRGFNSSACDQSL